MKNTLDEKYLKLIAQLHGDDVARQIEEGSPNAHSKRAPEAWLELVERPTEQTVRAVWAPAAAHLPRFVDYLAHGIEGAAVFQAYGALVLVIALPDWDQERQEPAPGLCWIGTPATPSAIERFMEEAGVIPPCLEALWRVASFVNTRQPSIMCSLDPAAHELTERPAILPPSRVDGMGDLYECLKIAVVNRHMVTCMVRPPGQRVWDDVLAVRDIHSGELSWGVRRKLDNMLVDISVLEW